MDDLILRLPARDRTVAGAPIRRVLPQAACRKVGPWVFFDHFGPLPRAAGEGMDVRPHPHCGLSTVSFLFEGAVEHRDSTGGHAIVRPGEVHWMRSGHGIVHSERTPHQERAREGRSHGIQLWCAHPDGQEEQEPRFDSYLDLPELDVQGVRVQLLCGAGWGSESPVEVTSPLVYAIAHLRQGQRLPLPDHPERCVYAESGPLAVDGHRADAHQMLVLDAHAHELLALSDTMAIILGGDPIGERFMWWNLVHSDRDRLREQAERWRRGEFPVVPGDEDEHIPAPPGP